MCFGEFLKLLLIKILQDETRGKNYGAVAMQITHDFWFFGFFLGGEIWSSWNWKTTSQETIVLTEENPCKPNLRSGTAPCFQQPMLNTVQKNGVFMHTKGLLLLTTEVSDNSPDVFSDAWAYP